MAAEARAEDEDATDTSSRAALVIGGLAVAALAVVAAVIATGGGGEGGESGGRTSTVSATHPSGVRIEAQVVGGGDAEITDVPAGNVADLPEHAVEEAAWRFSFDGEVVGETTVEVPEPAAASFAVMAGIEGEWRPVGFRRLGTGNLEVTIDAGEAAEVTAAPFTEGVLAAPVGAAYGYLSDLYVAVVEIYEDSWLDDLTDRADRLADTVYASYDEWANPPMCTRELAGATVDNDANPETLIRVCVEDRTSGPRIKVGNNTRFALEVSPISGVDVAHRSGGVDLGRLGADGIVAAGGETTEWTAADGSTLTVAAEFTEYAFLRQVVTWVLDLLPGGTEYFEYAELLGDAISILRDAWNTAGGLTQAIEHLDHGEYREAFSAAAAALANEEMIGVLIESGFFEKLGYELSEDAIGELFKVLEAAGHLADLGDLIYTAWATGGYVHGEATVRLPALEGEETTTAPPPASTSTGLPGDTQGSIDYGDSVSDTLEEGERHAWTFSGSSGDHVTITLSGIGGLDPVVELLEPDGTLLDENDDYDGIDSRIEFTLPETGTYAIVARSFGGESGSYELSLSRAGADTSTSVVSSGGGTISYGESVTGSVGEEGRHAWGFEGSAGDVITIDLIGLTDPVTGPLDPVVELLGPDGVTLAENDDFEGSDSRIESFVLPSSGTHTIIARGFGGAAGDYELELRLETGGDEATTTTEGGVTTTLTVPVDVGTGDVQITLLWSSGADLDLTVQDPDGNVISYRERIAPNGGQLDRDANGGCATTMDQPIENVFWPEGEAPRGDYLVRVDEWSNCGAGEPVAFELVVTIDGSEAHRYGETITEDSEEFDVGFTY